MFLFAFIINPLIAGIVGGAAIAIPVVIHLINRRRFKIVEWAAMKFLLAAQKQTRKRMRIEQLLLLLVRMLILALILFAMASVMPWAEAWWSEMGLAHIGKRTRTTRVHHVFVLDASLSMNQTVNGQPAFEAARQLVLKKIQDNPAGDGYSVLVLKDSPTWLVGEASQDYRKVMREIEAVKPTHGNSSLASALNMVSAKLIETKPRFGTQAVYFFTDMQRTTWLGAAPSDLKNDAEAKEKQAYLDIAERATTIFVDVGADNAGNVAVADIVFKNLYVTSNTNVLLTASVHNFSAETKKDLRVEVLTGKAKENANDVPLQMRVVSHKNCTFAPGERQTIEFDDFKFATPGTYAVQVKIADDTLNEDNTRTIVITVRETIPILIVNGKTSADRFERASEYLKLSLNPFPAGAEPKWAPLRPKVVTPSQFTDMTEAELEHFDCIFWCDVGPFGNNDVRKIDGHLRRGGGFIVSLGDRMLEHIDNYNRLLFKDEQGILPAKLIPYKGEKKVEAPAEHHFYLQNTDNNAYALPPLQAFNDDADRLTLRTARFRQFVLAMVPEGKARVVLSFMPEVANIVEKDKRAELPVSSPALVEWNPPLPRTQQPALKPLKGATRIDRQPARYRGKVLLLTSTVNMDWTTWPGSPSFGAMMHELTRMGVSGRLREQALTVGNMLEEYLPGGNEVEVTLHFPAGSNLKSTRVKTQVLDETNLFRWGDTDFSGLYRLDAQTGNEYPFAVNVPASSSDQKGTESDLGRVDEKKLNDLYPGWKLQVVRNPLMAAIAIDGAAAAPIDIYMPVGPTIANIALLIVLGLLFAEIVMAWYFGHYTTTEGALSGAPPGPTGTIVAAVVAVISTILFAIGALVITHEIRTGDFLGFLPELLRNWFEQFVGVPPLQPGEGSNWRYEKTQFLFGIPGPESWYAIFLILGACVTIFFTYRAEAPRVSLVYKLLLGALRMYLILLTLYFLLPRPQLQYAREGFPDMVLLIDDSRSMGEPDTFQDPKVIERVTNLSTSIQEQLKTDLPGRITALENEIAAKTPAAQHDPDVKAEVDGLDLRLKYWQKQRDNIRDGKWRPSRLQLIQGVLAQPEPHWLKTLLTRHRTKVHIFHLDATGRATKLRDPSGDAGELVDPNDLKMIERANKALARLEPVGNDSRLGTALRQVIDHYRGSALSSVIMFTDGVTTRDETIAQVAEYAASKNVGLYFVGVGDEQQFRDLKLHDLSVEDPIYIGDTAIFEVRLTGQGYKDLTVPVVLKVKGKDGKVVIVRDAKGNEVREMVKVDPNGKSVKFRLRDQPKEMGRKTYIIEVVPPEVKGNDKPIAPANLRIERTIEVIDTKLINVLYVEMQPRYEFRYIKFLLERESLDAKKKKSIDLKVLLLDADDDFHIQDKAALKNFPPTLEDLNRFDVLIFGDCDPNHKKLQNRLDDVVHYVRGEDVKGNKGTKSGGGILFMAGAFNNPHRYKGTPLASILPVEPLEGQPPAEMLRVDQLRPELTPAGKGHPIFRFSPDEGESLRTWSRLTPMYWNSSRYRIKPLAEVLAVHPRDKAVHREPNQDERHPLVVQQFVGTGRSMFFGFDETWRWRLREDESKFNTFWIQTMRYLSRGRTTRTDLRLDRQTPYRMGEEIKVTVRFPDNVSGGNPDAPKLDDTTKVKVTVTYLPPDEKKEESIVSQLTLAKVEGSWGTYEGKTPPVREGKYRIRLTNPDVTKTQPDGERPSAEAIVELPPGELDKLRMNQPEMIGAAETTQGKFYTLARADEMLDEMQPSVGPSLDPQVPPTLLWNQWWVFAIVLFLITSEWILRKWKHLL